LAVDGSEKNSISFIKKLTACDDLSTLKVRRRKERMRKK
jgi:hypothetical protein